MTTPTEYLRQDGDLRARQPRGEQLQPLCAACQPGFYVQRYAPGAGQACSEAAFRRPSGARSRLRADPSMADPSSQTRVIDPRLSAGRDYSPSTARPRQRAAHEYGARRRTEAGPWPLSSASRPSWSGPGWAD